MFRPILVFQEYLRIRYVNSQPYLQTIGVVFLVSKYYVSTYFLQRKETDFEICLVNASEGSGDNHSASYGTGQQERLL